MSKQTISVFGLGSMGFGVACLALDTGHHVCGFDVNIASQNRFLAKGGDWVEIAEAVAVSDVVVSCASVAPDLARELVARCDAFQVLYLDAPISGGSVKAAEGALTMMASGSADALDAIT